MNHTLLPGRPYPLGATVSSKGTNFAIFSQDATRVDLCLFNTEGKQTDCIALRERTAFVWHGFIQYIKPGQLYGYRIEGPWAPEKGHRFNYNKLLVDPYAKAISGKVDWKVPIFPYDVRSGDDLKIDHQDSADGVPKSVVVGPKISWDNDCPRNSIG
jgi:isoamylase